THALVLLGRHPEAVREARRALRAAQESRGDLIALSLISLGRALLRVDREEAAEAFEGALGVRHGRPMYAYIARLGVAAGPRAARESHEVVEALAGLEAWGDRRVLAQVLAEVRALLGAHPSDARVAELAPGGTAATPAVAAVVDAASALIEQADWTD